MPLGQRWVHLFLAARVTATAVAVMLLAVHRVTDHDIVLIYAALPWGAATTFAAWRWRRLFGSPLAWSVDAVGALALVTASEDWRSPFYLLALTTLAAPAATLLLRPALAWGAGFTVLYLGVAVLTGLDMESLRTAARLDTLATHLLLPVVATVGIAFTADAVRRFHAEQERSERLAVETERRRIAWELHDSAKQRLHAAALMLSAADEDHPMVAGALLELQGAVADMETSIAELGSPLHDRPLGRALRERAEQLQPLTGAAITVRGEAPSLPATIASHVYRIVAEAMSNAVRHAQARAIDVRLAAEDGRLSATVDDDGTGMPDAVRPGAAGVLTMQSRAFAIGGRLTIAPRDGGSGTTVRLDLPLEQGAAT